jgi:hypothetical protein
MANANNDQNNSLIEKLRKDYQPKEFTDDNDPRNEDDDPRSLKNDQLKIQSSQTKTDPRVLQDAKIKLDIKKLGEVKSKKIMEDILDSQIIGHEMAIKEIEDKIRSIEEEDLAQQNQSGENLLSNGSKYSARFSSQKSVNQDNRNNRREELKMLNDMLNESKEMVGKLQIKKNDEDFKRQMIEIMRESEELDSYNEYDEKRKGKNRVFLLPKEQVMSLSEVFGQAGIKYEVVEIPANQLQQQGSLEQANSNQNQVPQEQVMVIIVNYPQIIYQQQYQQGKERISQGGSWVELVENRRSDQGQLTAPSQSTNQVQGNSSGSIQFQARQEFGKFTKLYNENVVLQSRERSSLGIK